MKYCAWQSRWWEVSCFQLYHILCCNSFLFFSFHSYYYCSTPTMMMMMMSTTTTPLYTIAMYTIECKIHSKTTLLIIVSVHFETASYHMFANNNKTIHSLPKVWERTLCANQTNRCWCRAVHNKWRKKGQQHQHTTTLTERQRQQRIRGCINDIRCGTVVESKQGMTGDQRKVKWSKEGNRRAMHFHFLPTSIEVVAQRIS